MQPGSVNNADVPLLQRDRARDVVGMGGADGQRQVRMLAAKYPERIGQRLHRERRDDEHPQHCLLARAQSGGQPPHGLELRHEQLHFGVERLRLVRGNETALVAGEQCIAQLQLRMLKRLRHRRLRHVQQPGRGAHGAGEHDGVEDLDVLEPHGRSGRTPGASLSAET